MASAPSHQELPVFPPNPAETIAPTSSIDALGSALVGMTAEIPREVIKAHLADMDINAVVFDAQAKPIIDVQGTALGRELNPVERKFSDTIRYCASHALMRSPDEAAGTIEHVRYDVIHDDGVFVSKERPYSYYNRPQ